VELLGAESNSGAKSGLIRAEGDDRPVAECGEET
jgi:hypothetical protein